MVNAILNYVRCGLEYCGARMSSNKKKFLHLVSVNIFWNFVSHKQKKVGLIIDQITSQTIRDPPSLLNWRSLFPEFITVTITALRTIQISHFFFAEYNSKTTWPRKTSSVMLNLVYSAILIVFWKIFFKDVIYFLSVKKPIFFN